MPKLTERYLKKLTTLHSEDPKIQTQSGDQGNTIVKPGKSLKKGDLKVDFEFDGGGNELPTNGTASAWIVAPFPGTVVGWWLSTHGLDTSGGWDVSIELTGFYGGSSFTASISGAQQKYYGRSDGFVPVGIPQGWRIDAEVTACTTVRRARIELEIW